jgi:hypothetical protein
MTSMASPRLDPLSPPEPLTTPVVICPACTHGIDPHGTDPGGRCGVGNEQNQPCRCLWSPNDIAHHWMRHQHQAAEREIFEAAAAVPTINVPVDIVPLSSLKTTWPTRGYICPRRDCDHHRIVRVVAPIHRDENTGVLFWVAPSCSCSPGVEMMRYEVDPSDSDPQAVFVEPCS